MVMGETGDKLSSISIFQAFSSIMSINIPLARPSHMVKPNVSEARKYTLPLEAGNVVTAKSVDIGRGEELGAIMQSITVVIFRSISDGFVMLLLVFYCRTSQSLCRGSNLKPSL